MHANLKTRRRAQSLRRQLTRAETILWTCLRRRALGLQFRRQLPIGPYIADFACAPARLVVEVDGETHSTPAEQAHDETRRRFIEGEGWEILRVWNSDVYENEDGVVAAIMDRLQEIMGKASPPPR
jgi:very-short-patch-repair endonuclease